MEKDKISIIVPVYNTEKYLPKCLDSLLNQTYKNLEIICVNDQSPDNSLALLESYQTADDRIRIVSQQNTGLSGARNTGHKYVTGEYLMYVDSDDWLDLDTCQTAYNKLKEHDADVVIWSYVREFGTHSAIKNIFEEDELVFSKANGTIQNLHKRFLGLTGSELSKPENADAIVTAWGKLYKADIILKHNIEYVDTKIIGTEDALFNLYVFGHINTGVYINKHFNHYRKDNNTSLTKSYKSNLLSQWNQLFTFMNDYIQENHLDDSYTSALNNRVCLSIIGLGLNILNSNETGLTKIKMIKQIISGPLYRRSYKKLTLQYFPIHWKLFFFFAKYNNAFFVYLMLNGIKKLK